MCDWPQVKGISSVAQITTENRQNDFSEYLHGVEEKIAVGCKYEIKNNTQLQKS